MVISLTIENFKSIKVANLRLGSPFNVLVGANGTGKSNFSDVFSFISSTLKLGAAKTIRNFGGHICICHSHENENEFSFKAHRINNKETHLYIKEWILKIVNIKEKNPESIEFFFKKENKPIAIYENNYNYLNYLINKKEKINIKKSIIDQNFSISSTMNCEIKKIRNQFLNIEIFRFNPLSAKLPSTYNANHQDLDTSGSNLAAVLGYLTQDPSLREEISEWLSLIVPEMESVQSQTQQLDGYATLQFKELGSENLLPAYLISDGTIYALCIMVAVLSRYKEPGITIIEEPERGIHPKAIAELVKLIRSYASFEHMFFITTHSESVVRASEPNELWIVDKKQGQTQFKDASSCLPPDFNMPLDKAWMMNLFDGGLPW